MPYKKKTYKKKTYKKKPFKKNTKTIVHKNLVNMGLGFPKRMTMTHKYKQYVYMTSAAGALNVQHFSANGIYDPDVSGVGHQGFLADQCFALYNNFTVIGSKIKVTFLGQSAVQQAAACGILLNDNTTTTPTSYTMIGEQSEANIKYMGSTQSTGSVVLTKSFSAKKVYGGSVLGNSLLQGNAASNPTEQQYYTLFFQSMDITSTTIAYALAEIEYIVVWTELKDILGS